MNQQAPGSDLEDVAQLGEPKLICRISRKTLFWGFLLASLLWGFGVAALFPVLRMPIADWSKEALGAVVLLVIAAFSLWGGRAVWRKTNCKRRVQVTVYAGGLSYRDTGAWLICRWDEIKEVRYKVSDHYEQFHMTAAGVPIPGTTTRRLSHTSYHVTVRRKDGVQLVFTDELQNIVGLVKALQREANRTIGGSG